jgi:nitroreductase
MDLFEAIRTTRAMRRLDPDQEVSDEDLQRVLWAATKAATGSNRQHVRWLVVRDASLRRRVAQVYAQAAAPALEAMRQRAEQDATAGPLYRSSVHLAEHMSDAPVLVIPCAPGVRGRTEASVFPGVQNLMLAARALGLGTTLTTIHLDREAELKAVLGIPEEVHTFAIVPLGHPLGRWGEAPRKPISELAYLDGWERPLTS